MHTENQVMSKNNVSSSKKLRDHVLEAINHYFETINNDGVLGVHTLILDEVESAVYEAVMKFTKGNQVQAAKILGVSRGTLRTKVLLYFGTTRIGGLYQKYTVQPIRTIQHSVSNKST